jgi:hypothetical protein
LKPYIRYQVIGLAFLLASLWGSPLNATGDLEENMTVQAMLGATKYSDLNFSSTGSEDFTTFSQSEFTWVPLLGISARLPLVQKNFDAGLDGGALFGWRSERVSAYGQNGTIYVRIRNSLWLIDLFFGPYISTQIKDHTRLYAGAGPLLLTGHYERKTKEHLMNAPGDNSSGSSSSAFGVGLYARGGVEFRLPDDSWMGIGVRGFTTELDFDNVSGTTDVDGIQLIITYSPGP